MPDSTNKVLERGYRMINEGKTERALDLIKEFEQKMN